MIDAPRGTIALQRARHLAADARSDCDRCDAEMQMIYQDPYESLDPRFRVRDTIEEPLVIHGIGDQGPTRDADRRGAGAGRSSRPPDLFLDRFPHELSGGQRQRVAIAAALMLEPQLLLADEPVSMLDVSVRAGILALLDDLRRDGGMGILMITHDLSTAAHFADRIAVMYLGRIVEEGPAREVVQRPAAPVHEGAAVGRAQARPARRTEPQILQGETPNPVDVPPGCRFHPRCPVAEERCKVTDPQLHPRSDAEDDSHRAACVLV